MFVVCVLRMLAVCVFAERVFEISALAVCVRVCVFAVRALHIPP